MSMQPYSTNPIEQKKLEVRKNAKSAAIGLGVGVVALPIGMFASSFFMIVAIVGLIAGGYYGLQVRQAIQKDPNSPR